MKKMAELIEQFMFKYNYHGIQLQPVFMKYQQIYCYKVYQYIHYTLMNGHHSTGIQNT